MQPDRRRKKRRKRAKDRRSAKYTLRILRVVLLALLVTLAVLLVLFFAQKKKEAKAAEEAQRLAREEAARKQQETEFKIPDNPPEETEALMPETEETVQATTMIFTGDVLLHQTTLGRYQSSGLPGILSEDLIETFQNADILMINEEFPFGLTGEPWPDKQYTFRTDPQYVTAFQDMGVDLVGLANNHVLDYGESALLETFQTLDGAGIPYAGAGADLARASQLQVFEVNGKKFGFLAASRVWPSGSWAAGPEHPGCFGTYDPERLLAAIRAAKEEQGCDFVTVFVHWGVERNTMPEDYQKSLAKQYAEAGADLVIGMHPHVLQGIEYFGDTPAFYSLGNFIFGGNSYQTAAVAVTVYPDDSKEVNVIPCIAGGGFTRRAEGSEAQGVFDTLNALSFGAGVDAGGACNPL
ncbi:MAG: CapA family protein [Lachnospiraceae bacterium]|nr:CapA family protein [Lachnospiraceae bacterium]